MAHPEATEPISWGLRTLMPPGNRAALRHAVAARPGAAILESLASGGSQGRFSYYAIDPVRTLSLPSDGGRSPFDALARLWRPVRRIVPTPDIPFVAGWIGYLAYEAGRFVEPSAGWDGRTGPLPMSHGSLYDTLVVHDASDGRWLAVGVDWPPDLLDSPRPPLSERLDRLESLVRSATSSAPVGRCETSRDGPGVGCWNTSREAYLDKVRDVIAYIEAGDVFQVNIARRLRVEVSTDAPTLYQRLCESNPASFAAFLSVDALGAEGTREGGEPLWCGRLAGEARGETTGETPVPHAHAVMSSSPELFLKLVGRSVTTRPIKGTRPRGTTCREDAAAARALAASGKDRAELNMIVDLVRHDLGRVCEFGSVRVACPGEIETLPTVLHRTATVCGTLREGLDLLDLLRATFPGGSVTGAPKVRAMQIIQELESAARGPYCGAIGYVGLDGDAQLNLPIRTMTMADGVVDLSVGSGIVADSDPQEEYEELAAKAAGMLDALGLAPEPAAAALTAIA